MQVSTIGSGARALLAVLLLVPSARADTPSGTPPVPVPATADAALPATSTSLTMEPVALTTFAPFVVTVPFSIGGDPNITGSVTPSRLTLVSNGALVHAPQLPITLVAIFNPYSTYGGGPCTQPFYGDCASMGEDSSTLLPGQPARFLPVLRRSIFWRKVHQAVVDTTGLDVSIAYARGAPAGDAAELARSLGLAGLDPKQPGDWDALSAAVGSALGVPVTLSSLRTVMRQHLTCPVDPAAVRVVAVWQLVERLEVLGRDPGSQGLVGPWSDDTYQTHPIPPVDNGTQTVHLEMTVFPRAK